MKFFNLILFFLISPCISFSQLKSAEVIYKVESINFINNKSNPKGEELINTLKEICSHQTFILTFNQSNSKFSKVESLENQNRKDKLLDKIASLRFTSDFNFYINNKSNFAIIEKNDGTLIKDSLKKINWKITTQNKTINSYVCYLAIYEFKYMARDNKEKTKIISAWFAPELPFSYGPKNYYGLPGLILELHEKETIYVATNINFFHEEIKINFPKGKTITQEEYERKVSTRN